MNLGMYTYGFNNPLRYTDRDGKQSIDEALFKLRHWNAANAIGTFQKGSDNITTVATRFAYTGAAPQSSNMILSGEVVNQRTGEANAMRHVVWQAIIAGEFGGDIAEQAGTAHEGRAGRQTDMNRTVFSSYSAADTAVDLRNNAIGRQVGEANQGKSRLDIAKETLEKFHREGFWTAEKTKSGFELKLQPLSDEKYKAYKDALQRQDDNGRWIKQDAGSKTDSK